MNSWVPTAASLFAVLFCIIGITRTIEFKDVGLKPKNRFLFTALHILGCLLFTSALLIAALDQKSSKRAWMFGFFVTSLLCFAPGQFTLGMIRKKHLESQHSKLKSKS